MSPNIEEALKNMKYGTREQTRDGEKIYYYHNLQTGPAMLCPLCAGRGTEEELTQHPTLGTRRLGRLPPAAPSPEPPSRPGNHPHTTLHYDRDIGHQDALYTMLMHFTGKTPFSLVL